MQGAPDFAPVPRIPEPVPPRTSLREVGPSTTLGGELLWSPSTTVTRAGDAKQDAPGSTSRRCTGTRGGYSERQATQNQRTEMDRCKQAATFQEGDGKEATPETASCGWEPRRSQGLWDTQSSCVPPAPHPERLSPSPHSRPLRTAVASVPPGHHARATHQAIRRTPRGDSSSSLGSQTRSYLPRRVPPSPTQDAVTEGTPLHQAPPGYGVPVALQD